MDPPGGHPSGILWALTFEAGRAAHLPDPRAEVRDWAWLHFPLGDVRAGAFIAGLDYLPAAAQEMIEARDDRIQLHTDGAWTYGVLPDLERDLAGKTLGAGRLYFALDRRRLITARLHALRVVDDVRREAERGLLLETAADALVALVEHFTETVEARLERLADKIDVVEDQVLSEPDEIDGRQLGPFRRELARHRREFQSLRTVLVRARSGRQGRRADPIAEHLGPLIAPIEDLDHEAAALQERARLLHEEIDTLINGATNRSMRTLAVISTLLIPPTLIVGAFGMNVEGIPFGHSKGGFAAAVFLCAVVVAGATVLLRRLRLLS